MRLAHTDSDRPDELPVRPHATCHHVVIYGPVVTECLLVKNSGWNGTAWDTRWIDPYGIDGSVPEDELWRYTCQTIDTGGDGSHHPNPKQLARKLLASKPDWPEYVMLGWPEGRANIVSYSFPSAAGGKHTPICIHKTLRRFFRRSFRRSFWRSFSYTDCLRLQRLEVTRRLPAGATRRFST